MLTLRTASIFIANVRPLYCGPYRWSLNPANWRPAPLRADGSAADRGPASEPDGAHSRVRSLARRIVVHDALLPRWSSAPRVARADRPDRALWRTAMLAQRTVSIRFTYGRMMGAGGGARGQFVARSHSAMLWTCSISSATASRALHEGTTGSPAPNHTAVHDHPPVLGPTDEGVARCWAWLPACAKYLLQMCQCRWITPTADCGVICPSRVS
jgi:hypothetical protein